MEFILPFDMSMYAPVSHLVLGHHWVLHLVLELHLELRLPLHFLLNYLLNPVK